MACPDRVVAAVRVFLSIIWRYRSCNLEQVESVGGVPVLPKEVFLFVNLSLQQIIFTKKLSEKEFGKLVFFLQCVDQSKIVRSASRSTDNKGNYQCLTQVV